MSHSLTLLSMGATPSVQNHVSFLENFFDEVRRKVPVGK
jgi:hypothetical protein